VGPELSHRHAGCRAPDTDAAAGFTLIELTVVVAVPAVGVGLSASRSGPSDAQRFERYMQAARAQAIQGRQTLGLFMTSDGYIPATKSTAGWEKRARNVPAQSGPPRGEGSGYRALAKWAAHGVHPFLYLPRQQQNDLS
jgi:prepilin-type N-terminal cleavage/methylation domain-containing protein